MAFSGACLATVSALWLVRLRKNYRVTRVKNLNSLLCTRRSQHERVVSTSHTRRRVPCSGFWQSAWRFVPFRGSIGAQPQREDAADARLIVVAPESRFEGRRRVRRIVRVARSGTQRTGAHPGWHKAGRGDPSIGSSGARSTGLCKNDRRW